MYHFPPGPSIATLVVTLFQKLTLLVVTLVANLPPASNVYDIYHRGVTTLVVHLKFLMSWRIFDKKCEKSLSESRRDWSKMFHEKNLK
jgi:hypothetical protein